MQRRNSLILAAALAAAGAGAASAEAALEGVHWQTGRADGARVVWQDAKSVSSHAPKLDARVRARLVIKNDGAKNDEGLLLRYAAIARVSSGAGTAAAWAVPFVVDEKHVPKVAAGKMIDVPIDLGPALDLYLKRLARSGWWLDRIKVQVMLEPREGAKALQLVEDVVEIKP
jgi:hypothetical protein